MIKERGNQDSLFSPLTDADSPARFLLKDLLWLQAVFAGIEEDVVELKGKSAGSGSCEKGEKVKQGREGGRSGRGGTNVEG